MKSNEALREKIQELKKKRRAVILVHNYQLPEVQDIADFRGDSLELSRAAAGTDARVIVFCGVRFMAETAAILSPRKLVLMPDAGAGCPMADMLSPAQLKRLKSAHPQATVVGYVNSSAAVKALLDVCCTSANAVAVVSSLKDAREIIFVPDKYLAAYVQKTTGRKLIVWEGFCPSHGMILPADVIRAKKSRPQAKVLAHPECLPEVLAMSDEVLSTSGMGKYARESGAREMIICTEPGLIYRLKKDNPGKEFYPAAPGAVCPEMKKTTLEKVLYALENLREEVTVPDTVRRKAKKAIDRMLEIS